MRTVAYPAVRFSLFTGDIMISIKVIATKCGVSVATVSKALNNKNDISQETYIKHYLCDNRNYNSEKNGITVITVIFYLLSLSILSRKMIAIRAYINANRRSTPQQSITCDFVAA